MDVLCLNVVTMTSKVNGEMGFLTTYRPRTSKQPHPWTSRRSETEKFDKKKEKEKGKASQSQDIKVQLFVGRIGLDCAVFYVPSPCWADTPGPIPIKFGIHVTPHDVIKVSNFWWCSLWCL